MEKKPDFSGIYQYSFKNQKGKKYIGSSINLRKRHINHMSALKLKKHPLSHLQRDFDKYGIENLVYEILEFVDNTQYMNKVLTTAEFQEILFEKEQLYLNKYFAQEYIKDSSDIRFFKLLYNKSVITKYNYTEHRKLQEKSVHKYDLEGNYLESYFNSMVAEACTNIESSSIRRVCLKQRNSAGNYLWSHKKVKKIKPVRNKTHKFINQYDENKKFIKRFTSIKEAQRETKIDIRKNKANHCILQGGFYWLFDNEEFPERKRRMPVSEQLKNTLLEEIKLLVAYPNVYKNKLKFIRTLCQKYDVTVSIVNRIMYKFIKETDFQQKNIKQL